MVLSVVSSVVSAHDMDIGCAARSESEVVKAADPVFGEDRKLFDRIGY